MKKIASIVLTFVIAFSLCSHSILSAENVISIVQTTPSKQSASNGTCGENLTWTLDNEGTLTISGTGGMWTDYEYTDTPWYSSRSNVKKVVIGNGVTHICFRAFRDCSNLTSITVDKNNNEYSNDEYGVLFDKNKTRLIQYPMGNERASYVIPDGVTIIRFYAFEDCYNLISVVMPDSVTSINDMAFSGCSSLTLVKIPDSVTSIGNWAFTGCSSLTSVKIPDSVISIGYSAFDHCDSLTSITVDANNEYYTSDEYGVLFTKDKTTLIQYPIGNERTSYVIPDGVTSIGERAFYKCSNLTSVTIPDSVTSIGDWAFGYSSLAVVTIPDSVTRIADYAFYRCDNLTSITVDVNNEYYASDECGVLFNKDKTTLIQYTIGNEKPTYVIPDSVTSIGHYAFYDCYRLTSVTIPDSVTSIDETAFEGCSSLANVYYLGTEEEWRNTAITYHPSYPSNIKVHLLQLSQESSYAVNKTIDAIVAKASVKSGESLEKFLTNITTDPECVRVVDADGNIQTDVTKLITGCKFQLLGPNGSVLKNYEIVILGDTDRNGRFSISDVSGVQSAVAAKPDKNTVEFLEANIDGNSRLSVTDASALQSFLANGTW